MRGREWLIVGGVTAIAIALRLFGLDRKSVWFDEAITYFDAHVAWSDLLDAVRQDVHPPLVYVLYQLWPWVDAGDFWFRLPSAVLGAAAAPMAWLWARRIGSPSEALLTGLFVAVSPLLIDLAQDARMYGLLLLLTATSLWLLDRLLQKPTWRDYLAYVAVCAAILYTHYFGAFILLAEGLAALLAYFSRPHRHGGRVVLGCLVLAGLAFVPWLPVLAQQVGSIRGDYWIETPSRSVLLGTFLAFAAHTPPGEAWRLPLQLAYAGQAVLLTLGVLHVMANAKQRIAILLLVVPIGVALTLSVLMAPIYAIRYVSPVALGFGFVMARGIDRRRPHVSPAFNAVVGFGPLILSLWPLYADPGYARADLRSAAHTIQAMRQPSDVILHLGAFTVAPFDYYAVAQPAKLLLTNERSELCQAQRGHSGAWLVTAYAPADDQVRAAAEAGITDPNYAGGQIREPPQRFLGVSVFHLSGDC